MSKVLLVDDDDTIVCAVARSLARASHDVTCATSASVAIERRRFDVIVSDIMMPGLSGIDLLREARKRDHVLVVLMADAPMAAVELGAYLRKPSMWVSHGRRSSARRRCTSSRSRTRSCGNSKRRAHLPTHARQGWKAHCRGHDPEAPPSVRTGRCRFDPITEGTS